MSSAAPPAATAIAVAPPQLVPSCQELYSAFSLLENRGTLSSTAISAKAPGALLRCKFGSWVISTQKASRLIFCRI